MKYLVIVNFTDLQDNDYQYRVGDEFPRSGAKVSKERLEELSTSKNRRGIPLLSKLDEPKAIPVKPENDTVQEVPAEEKKTPTRRRSKKQDA